MSHLLWLLAIISTTILVSCGRQQSQTAPSVHPSQRTDLHGTYIQKIKYPYYYVVQSNITPERDLFAIEVCLTHTLKEKPKPEQCVNAFGTEDDEGKIQEVQFSVTKIHDYANSVAAKKTQHADTVSMLREDTVSAAGEEEWKQLSQDLDHYYELLATIHQTPYRSSYRPLIAGGVGVFTASAILVIGAISTGLFFDLASFPSLPPMARVGLLASTLISTGLLFSTPIAFFTPLQIDRSRYHAHQNANIDNEKNKQNAKRLLAELQYYQPESQDHPHFHSFSFLLGNDLQPDVQDTNPDLLKFLESDTRSIDRLLRGLKDYLNRVPFSTHRIDYLCYPKLDDVTSDIKSQCYS